MTSNTVVALHDVINVLLASQFKSSLAGSVALFTHCQADQLSVMTDFVILNRRTQARIKNCTFFGSNEAFFIQLTCKYAWVPRLGVDNVACRVVQTYLKRCCSLCEALVETKVCSKVRCIAPPTNLHSTVGGVHKPLFFFILMFRAWIPCHTAMLHISWTVHVQAMLS